MTEFSAGGFNFSQGNFWAINFSWEKFRAGMSGKECLEVCLGEFSGWG